MIKVLQMKEALDVLYFLTLDHPPNEGSPPFYVMDFFVCCWGSLIRGSPLYKQTVKAHLMSMRNPTMQSLVMADLSVSRKAVSQL